MFIIYILVLIIGLAIGSFINVIVMRLGRKKGIFLGRSECPNCSHRLSWLDLIPVFSFIFLVGRCRYCKIKISPLYLIGELFTAGVFMMYLVFNGFIWTPGVFIDLATLSILISLALFDAKHFILPDKLVLVLFFVGFLNSLETGWLGFLPLMGYGFVLSIPFVIMYLASGGRWLGLGDAKLVFVLGVIFGPWLGLALIIVSVWAAALLGITMIIIGKATPKTALPFGSFMCSVAAIFIVLKSYVEIYINQFII